MPSQFLITTLVQNPAYMSALQSALEGKAYDVIWNQEVASFLTSITENNRGIVCLLLEHTPNLKTLLAELKAQKVLLPVVVIEKADSLKADPDVGISDPAEHKSLGSTNDNPHLYHGAVVHMSEHSLDHVDRSIHQAIDYFLKLPASHHSDESEAEIKADEPQVNPISGLAAQQKRLAEKLKERLGYLGVYYKRNPQNFLRSMSRLEKQRFINQLRSEYREIILVYFSKDSTLNQKIDSYVNAAFFADIAVSQVVEVHMELMDEFSKQLQLEGRSEDILLDYRLTLIDVIAHLCEMYRRSIPRGTDA